MVGGGVRHRGCVLGALYSMHGLPPLYPRKTGYKPTLALWGLAHLGGGGASSRGQGQQWGRSIVCKS